MLKFIIIFCRDQAAQKINNWVSKRTKDKISSIVSPNDILPSTTLMLVNAMHFDAKWHKTFERKNTTIEKFYGLNGKTFDVPTMRQKVRTRYANLPEYGVELVDIPYSGFEYSLTIVLPEDYATNDYVHNKLDDLINVVKNTVNNADVSVELPKFKIEDNTNYENLLRVVSLFSFVVIHVLIRLEQD